MGSQSRLIVNIKINVVGGKNISPLARLAFASDQPPFPHCTMLTGNFFGPWRSKTCFNFTQPASEFHVTFNVTCNSRHWLDKFGTNSNSPRAKEVGRKHCREGQGGIFGVWKILTFIPKNLRFLSNQNRKLLRTKVKLVARPACDQFATSCVRPVV